MAKTLLFSTLLLIISYQDRISFKNCCKRRNNNYDYEIYRKNPHAMRANTIQVKNKPANI